MKALIQAPAVILARYDSARQALQAASSVDEVKDIRDKALAMAAYARQARDTDLIEMATEIRVRAERKAGEMLAAMDLQHGSRGIGKSGVIASNPTPVLANMGITKSQSSRWQKLAAVPEDKFEQAVAAAKEVASEISARSILQPHVSHNSGNNEWYTPPEIIACARGVMGHIHIDPASSDMANRTVRADTYYTAADDGLTKPWIGHVWMNPPYAQPLIGQFAQALAHKFSCGEVTQACVLVNNATETEWFQTLARSAFAICFLAGRVKFLNADGNRSGAPLQGQAVLYLGSQHSAFTRSFRSMGLIVEVNHG